MPGVRARAVGGEEGLSSLPLLQTEVGGEGRDFRFSESNSLKTAMAIQPGMAVVV